MTEAEKRVIEAGIPLGAKPVSGFTGYFATPDGSIWSVRRRRVALALKPYPHPSGYLYVSARKDGSPKSRGFKVHRLVLHAFVGSRPAHLLHGRHLDGNKANNGIDNLAWGTAKENADDALKHGHMALGERVGNSKLTREIVIDIRKSARDGTPYKDIASEYRLDPSTVSEIARGRGWRHVAGYVAPDRTHRLMARNDPALVDYAVDLAIQGLTAFAIHRRSDLPDRACRRIARGERPALPRALAAEAEAAGGGM